MEKNSFTILETLISCILLSVIIIGFSKYSFYDNFDKEFILLNKIDNSFNTKSYNKDFTKKFQKISIIQNNSQEKDLLIKTIIYNDNRIKLFKYEL
ncbi:MAG: hypothetical protein GY932_07400 [Arcobacter sp.]|nr:hypothetical protein [Arcobacter sp.]